MVYLASSRVGGVPASAAHLSPTNSTSSFMKDMLASNEYLCLFAPWRLVHRTIHLAGERLLVEGLEARLEETEAALADTRAEVERLREKFACALEPGAFDALPFDLPICVEERTFRTLIERFARLSRSTYESKHLGKTCVVGDLELIGLFVDVDARLDVNLTPGKLLSIAQEDLAIVMCGTMNEGLKVDSKVYITAGKQDMPDWSMNDELARVGARHKSAAAMARALQRAAAESLNPRGGGLCILAAESGEIGTVKVFLGQKVYLYNSYSPLPWRQLDPADDAHCRACDAQACAALAQATSKLSGGCP